MSTQDQSPERGSATSRGVSTPDNSGIVFVVDDDVSVRDSIALLLRSDGFQVETFCSAPEFLKRERKPRPACLVLDVELPELNGLELQERMAADADQSALPIIFITGHGDIPMSVRAMKAGAIEFLTKPIDGDALLSAVNAALQCSINTLSDETSLKSLRDDYATLTTRERDVMALVVAGRLNKQAAGDLGITEPTVKAHRGQVMRKMKARSLAHLVSMAARLGFGAASEH